MRDEPLTMIALGDSSFCGEYEMLPPQVSAWYNNVPHVFIITLRELARGEEFLLDYGEEHWTRIDEAYTRCRSILVRPVRDTLSGCVGLAQRERERERERERGREGGGTKGQIWRA